jgi:hypothetical protein
MSGEESDALATYVAASDKASSALGWAMFLFFAMMPLFIAAMLLVSFVFLFIYVLVFFGMLGVAFLLSRRVPKSRPDIWIDPWATKPMRQARRTGYFFASGFLMFSVLSILFWWWYLTIRYEASFAEFWETALFYVIIGINGVVFFPLTYLVTKYLEKKYMNDRRRYKRFSGKKEDVERTVEKALRSLNLGFHEGLEGSKWLGEFPALKIDGYDISVMVFHAGPDKASITTVARTPLDSSKAEDVERTIDSLLKETRLEQG